MDVVIAGAGIGGLAAGAALARAGHSVRCCERSPTARTGGAGIVLQPNGLAVLDALGIADKLVADGSILTGATVFDHRGRPLSSVPIEPGPVAAPALVVYRSDLLAALTEAAQQAGATVEFGIEVTTSTEAMVALHRDCHVETVKPALLVAADGASSALRQTLRFETRPLGKRRSYLRTIVPGTAPDTLIGEHWGDGIAGVLPCGSDATYLYATATDDVRAADEASNCDALIAALSSAHPSLTQIIGRIESINDISINDVRAVLVSKFVDGRTVLLGDAAHPMAPNLGQGANSALVDVAALTIAIDEHPDIDQALTAYDQNRRPTVRGVQKAAESLARLGHFRHAHALRDLAIRATPAALVQRQALAVQQCDPVELARRLIAAWLTRPPPAPKQVR